MKCDKTGLTDNDWGTILDVLNMYDPGDNAHVCPAMATPEFMQDVSTAFKTVLQIVKRINDAKELALQQGLANHFESEITT